MRVKKVERIKDMHEMVIVNRAMLEIKQINLFFETDMWIGLTFVLKVEKVNTR